jgi:hypothetical protein
MVAWLISVVAWPIGVLVTRSLRAVVISSISACVLGAVAVSHANAEDQHHGGHRR